jgi:enoyl-CoA hydratase/carnithine racemase
MFKLLVEERIAIITIDTGKGNTFSVCDLVELNELISQVGANDNIKGLIITGTGQCFSIGGNLDYINSLQDKDEVLNYFKILDELLLKLFSFDKPLCSAINGHAIGLGFLIMLCSDITVSSNNPKIKFGLPEIKIGMAIDSLMCEILEFNQISGNQLAKIIYSGELFDLPNINSLNLIDHSTDVNLLMSDAKLVVSNFIESKFIPFIINKSVIRKKKILTMQRLLQENCYEVFTNCFK